MKKVIRIDRETVNNIKGFDNEIRLTQIKESLDELVGGDIYVSDLTSEQVAKLDYVMCEIETLIHKNKGAVVQIEDCLACGESLSEPANNENEYDKLYCTEKNMLKKTMFVTNSTK